MSDTMRLDKTYIADTYGRFQTEITSAKGAQWYDDAGKRYIDMGAGIAVNTLGACEEGWADAVCAQARRLSHVSNLYYSAPQARLAEILCTRANMRRVFFCNSGAEANEGVIKAARKYGEATRRHGIVTLKNSFHGRTLATLAATGQDVFHQHFGPFPDGFYTAMPDDIEDMQRVLDTHDCCAVLIELVQGEGGVHALDRDYVKALEALCRARDVLLCVDEVQTGNGRTGYLYAYMGYSIQPDLVSTAKGLAGGLPMGAVLFGEKTEHTLTRGEHGSTFGGNPICAAAALYVMSRLTDEVLKGVRQKGARMRAALEGAPGVKQVDGMGMMLGVLPEKPVRDVIAACMARGVTPLSAKDRLRLMPPLTIDDALLTEALTIIREVLASE